MQSIVKQYSSVEQAQVGIVQYLYNAESAERIRVGRAVMHDAFGRLSRVAKILASSESRPDILKLKGEGMCGTDELVDMMGFDCMPMDGDNALRRYFKTIYGDYFALRARRQEEMSPEDVRIMSEVYEKMESSLGFGPVRDIADELSEYQEQYDVSGGKVGVPSPFPQLDAYIRGVEKKKIYTVAAFSNVGKSRFLYYLAQNCIRRRKGMFFSLETDGKEVMGNIACSYHGIDWATMLRRGNCHREMPLEKLVIRDDCYEIDQIISEIDAQRPEWVFIDYAQHIADSSVRSDNDNARLESIMRKLQRAAKKYDCAVFLASQVNNDSRFKDAEQVTLRGSGAMFYASDAILVLSRVGEELRITLVKNKMGKTNITWRLDADMARLQFCFGSEIAKNAF